MKDDIMKTISNLKAEVEGLKDERRGYWEAGNREMYNKTNEAISELNQHIKVLMEAYNITADDAKV